MLSEPAMDHQSVLPPASAPVERTAFYLESEGQSLFAWLHRPAGGSPDHGVLICPPLGHEQVHSHRALRHLAERLAGQGFAVLRLDYHGMGDSDGTDLEPRRFATWQANIRDAANWLQQQAGCDKVSLIGLRMGATLAALYAETHDVENLVLWAPLVKGRRYVRELGALSQMAAFNAGAESSSLEAVGFVFTQETALDLARVDLTKLSPRFRHALMVLSDKGPAETPPFAGIESIAVPGYEEMMAEPHDALVPETALLSITNWMAAKAAPSPRAPIAALSLTSCMATSGPSSVKECIHRIEAVPGLFGIMTESGTPDANLPWIVILNAGAAYRVGPGRLHVQLARTLAPLGYSCLRVDISGLGDSLADVSQEENDTYAATAFRDIAVICDYLQGLQPGRPIVLMGLCSGAYAAFQSMVQLPHPTLVEGIMINPLTFFWQEGMTIKATPNERLHAWHYYWNIIFDLKNWQQLFSGKSNMGVIGALQRFNQRVMARPATPTQALAKSAATKPQIGYSHPAKEDLRADLARVANASRNLAMFISDNDPGHFLLMYKARRKAKQLIRKGILRCFFIHDADHTFSTESARKALSQTLIDYLQSRQSAHRGWRGR